MPNAGFSDPVFDSQATFRALLAAAARPGSIQTLPAKFAGPSAIGSAMGALALTLLDHETPVWLDPSLAAAADVSDWLRFYTGAPLVSDPAHCAFALVGNAALAPEFSVFLQGSAEFPDRSTTIVLSVDTFTDGPQLSLVGPGIRGRRRLSAAPLPPDMEARLVANRARFPCGVDLFLVSADHVAALPRSVRLESGAR